MAKAHTLVDNFNDNTIDQYHATTNPTGRWNVSAGAETLREVNGRVEIRPLDNAAGSYSTYTSATTYDLTESGARVELVRVLVQQAGTDTYFGAALDTANRLSFNVSGGFLRAAYILGGVDTTLAAQPYDVRAHRWLRLRALAGSVSWEVSPDGVAWMGVASTAGHPFDLTALQLFLGAGTSLAQPAPGTAIFDNFNVQNTSLARRVEERRLSARDVRVQAAEVAAARRHDEHANNNDESNYPNQPLIGNYSKGLRHDTYGDPEPGSYATLLRALQSEDPADFEEITLGIIATDATRVKLTNPQAGLAFDIAGPDAQAFTLPPAPRFDSEVAAHEAGELYWMAVARDVPFAHYTSSPEIAAAIASLNGEFPRFGGTTPVTAQNVFRGIYPGEQVGPYVSQFLLKGNNDPRKPTGFGRDAIEGYISSGSRSIDQRIIPAVAGVDYLTDFTAWLNVQNGADVRGADSFVSGRRFIHNLRGGATFVHFDQVVDAFYNAAWILMSEPTGNQYEFLPNTTGRPQIDLEFPMDQGNPYDPPGTALDARKQAGFATFGPIHLLQTLSEVLGRALRATWWQKWGVHRRLRP